MLFLLLITVEKSDAEKDSAKHTALSATEQANKDLNVKLILVFSSVLFLSVGGLAYSRYLVKKRANEQLEEKNIEIEKQKEELERLNEELQQRYAETLESEKNQRKMAMTKDRFFSVIANDLKKPLSGFLTSTYLLSNNFDKLQHKEIKQRIKQLDNTSRKLFTFLENLILWSKLQTSTIDYFPEKINLKELVDTCSGLLASGSKQKNITVKTDIGPNTEIYADLNITMTIVRNLISNAIKFSKENSIISINAEKRDSFIYLSISDQGIGISKDKINSLFSLDLELQSNPVFSEYEFTGLGLILSKELAERQDGLLSVESNEGEGSTFTVSFNEYR